MPPNQSGEAQQSAARRRLAAQRAAAAKARRAAARRRRLLLTVGLPSTVVVVVVAVLVVLTLVTGAGGPKSGQAASAAASGVVAQVASVPASVLNEVGVGTASAKPTTITAPALTTGGKPEVLYIGAEYCPYCAAERWAVVVALSRFGAFSGLGETASSPSDVFPNTSTLTFHGASYASNYLTFTGKEIQSNQVVNGKYAPLDTLSSAQQALFDKYDAPPYPRPLGPSRSSTSVAAT